MAALTAHLPAAHCSRVWLGKEYFKGRLAQLMTAPSHGDYGA
jgi:hypothetical protein